MCFLNNGNLVVSIPVLNIKTVIVYSRVEGGQKLQFTVGQLLILIRQTITTDNLYSKSMIHFSECMGKLHQECLWWSNCIYLNLAIWHYVNRIKRASAFQSEMVGHIPALSSQTFTIQLILATKWIFLLNKMPILGAVQKCQRFPLMRSCLITFLTPSLPPLTR